MSQIEVIRKCGIANRHDACILELADRLDKLETASKADTTESPPGPFRVTEAGRYRLKNGEYVVIYSVDNESDLYEIGAVVGGWEAKGCKAHTWNRLGHYTSDPDRGIADIYDIVEGPIPNKREPTESPPQPPYTSGSKYLEIVSPHEIPTAYGPYDDPSECGEESLVIDLTKISDEAIVQRGPEPEPSPALKRKEDEIKRLRDAIAATDRAAQDLQIYSTVGDPDAYYEKAKALVKTARAAMDALKGEE